MTFKKYIFHLYLVKLTLVSQVVCYITVYKLTVKVTKVLLLDQ